MDFSKEKADNRPAAFFRADSSFIIGSGHVMRCLTFADMLKDRGIQTTFIIRKFKGHLKSCIQKRGHQVVMLPAPDHHCPVARDGVLHAPWLGVGWEQDAAETSQVIGDSRPDWLIVDHYAIDVNWHLVLRGRVRKIFVIDDLADREHDCDFLLDQTHGRGVEDYQEKIPTNCKALIGPLYALLMPEFAKYREKALARRQQLDCVRRILVFMGGTDPDNITADMMTILEDVQWNDISPQIDIVLGQGAPHLESIDERVSASRMNIHLMSGVDNMAELMCQADLAIGAGGTASWERCCLGLPALITINADNQIEIARQLELAGAVINLGPSDRISPEKTKQFIGDLVESGARLNEMSRNAASVCDGHGVSRVVEMMQ